MCAIKKNSTRIYNEKEWNFRKWSKRAILFILSPAWLPLYLLVWAANYIEELLDAIDSFIDLSLDKTTPRLKENKKNGGKLRG